jgi:hypothetical protein
MGVVYNRRNLGLYNNGQFTEGQKGFEYERVRLHVGSPVLSGTACLGIGSPSVYGTGFLSEEFIPVDTSKYYQHSVSVKAIENNYLGNVAGGHLGFSCYDDQQRFIDLRTQGGIGDTTLAKDLNAGDSYVYITSNSGWRADNAQQYFNHILLYPATHPEFSAANEYTRIGYGDYNIWYDGTATILTGSPPAYRLRLTTSDLTTATTFPSIGYSTPAGTPVSNGQSGGTYNYCHSNPNHTLGQWVTYTTTPFTGESRNSTQPFRFGTKYVKFLNLRNYNTRTETGGSSPRYLLDNIMLVECPDGQAWPDKLFNRTTAI